MEIAAVSVKFNRIAFVERLNGDSFTSRLASLADALDIPKRGRTSWLKDIADLSKPGAHKWFNSEDPNFCPHESSLDSFAQALENLYNLPVSREELKNWIVDGQQIDSNKKRQPLIADKSSIYISHLMYDTLGEQIFDMPSKSLSHILNATISYHEQMDVEEDGLKVLILGVAATLQRN